MWSRTMYAEGPASGSVRPSRESTWKTKSTQLASMRTFEPLIPRTTCGRHARHRLHSLLRAVSNGRPGLSPTCLFLLLACCILSGRNKRAISFVKTKPCHVMPSHYSPVRTPTTVMLVSTVASATILPTSLRPDRGYASMNPRPLTTGNLLLYSVVPESDLLHRNVNRPAMVLPCQLNVCLLVRSPAGVVAPLLSSPKAYGTRSLDCLCVYAEEATSSGSLIPEPATLVPKNTKNVFACIVICHPCLVRARIMLLPMLLVGPEST